MSWRPAVATFAILLLPLPLVLAVEAGRFQPRRAEAHETRPVSPILSLEERRELMTHERHCQTAEDCEPPLACLDLDWGRALCMASECQTDLQCAEGFTCRALRSRGQGPWVRTCVVRGTAEEGAPCSATFTFTQEAVCRPGLLCNDYCGRPCQLGEPGACPEGTLCLQGKEGPSCMPTCDGRACPEGQACVPFKDGSSVCARVWGENCQHQACPEGASCSVSYMPGRPGEVQMECVRRCGADHPSCPEGTVCEQKKCRRPCDSKDAQACGPLETCAYYPDTRRSLCAVNLREPSQH
jgi:hypothetical protein